MRWYAGNEQNGEYAVAGHIALYSITVGKAMNTYLAAKQKGAKMYTWCCGI